MTTAEIADLRTRRRALVRRLRADGLSLREIARQVGVSHPTVLADLAATEPDQEDTHERFNGTAAAEWRL
ncbi:helix-turn-helix domain-containing protein [Micromonospora sp. MS34]|uniref:helix-turn-helix domain-containing protein n=1 Tax=Micromonospora sp. MS34 TaxID=3385971 RepID=UPI0039A2FE21